MIIKGKSRGGPKQLATHLLRADTNERVEILELQSLAPSLDKAFLDWQLIAEGTNGRRGLYHANIDPDARYTMTAGQWLRAVNVLERELGLDGQPRAVILHEKKDRQHLHVVWQRTDIDSMTLVSDSQNYHAHERASLALEKEFGHAQVPGKHAKRDTDQPAPKSDLTHAEWQQAERSGIDPRAFKDQVTALYQASENGTAFVAALEAEGLMLAKGDRRDFVLVDPAQEVYSLARQVRGVTAKELQAFMSDVYTTLLPTVGLAKARQAQRGTAEAQPLPEGPKVPPPGNESESLDKLDAALKAWQAEEVKQLAAFHAAERKRAMRDWTREASNKLKRSDSFRSFAMARYDRKVKLKGIRGFVERVIEATMPAWAARRQWARGTARMAVVDEFRRERREQIARLREARTIKLEYLTKRQALQMEEREKRFEHEVVLRMREYEDARAFAAKLAEQEQERQRQNAQTLNDTRSSGPEPPARAR